MIPFSNTDIAIVVFYMMLVLGVGFYYAQRRQETSTDYFLAGRNVGWFAIGVSIFAANISSEHFIGLAGHGASRGWQSDTSTGPAPRKNETFNFF